MSRGRFVPSRSGSKLEREKTTLFIISIIIIMSPPPPLSESHTAESLRNLFASTFSWFLPENVIDEDTLEYLFTSLSDGSFEDKEEFLDFVTPLLMELFEGDDEDEARAQCTKAHDLLYGKCVEEGSDTTKEEETTTRVINVKLGGTPGEEEESEFEKEVSRRLREKERDRLPDFSTNTNHRNQNEDKAQEKEQRKMRKKLEESEEEVRKLLRELDVARETAAKRRIEGSSSGGNGSIGTIEVGPFNVPNPGGGQDLINDCVLTFVPGRRYALIGRNGTGKSTLLKYLASRRVGDKVGFSEDVFVHYVNQEVTLNEEQEEWLPVDVVLHADVQRRLLLEELKELESNASGEGDVQRISVVHEHLDSIESSSAHARASQLLRSLGFSEELASRKMKQLSGGWRVRTSLAAALFATPDILFLDEPTNHLSIQAVMFLAKELVENPVWKSRIIVCVSHDRHFLDETTTDSLHISGVAKRVTSHRMNYSSWAKKRREQQIALKKRTELRQIKIDTLKEFAGHGFRYGGSSSQINMMQKKASEAKKLELEAEEEQNELADLEEDRENSLSLCAGGELQSQSISMLESCSFRYPNTEKDIFTDVDLSVDSKSRVVLLGENGQGKTTLVKVITNALKSTGGSVKRDHGARISLVNQHHAEQLKYDMTPLQFMLEKYKGDGSYKHEQEIRGHLSSCGVPTALQSIPSGSLSGGQRSRVAMAAVSYFKPHLIVLDEPTNNLDLESCEALAKAISDFKGGVILVSHDQFFVEQVGKEFIAIENGRAVRFENFKKYRASIAAKMPK
jgi:ATP-binding cassette subfamily F protein 3